MKEINREKTNSITHLVKIVAQEVYEENYKQERVIIKGIQEEVCKLRKELDELKEIILYSTEKELETDKVNLLNKGRSWTDFEDRLLKREIECAFKKIANNHKRTEGAIRSRINQKELIWG